MRTPLRSHWAWRSVLREGVTWRGLGETRGSRRLRRIPIELTSGRTILTPLKPSQQVLGKGTFSEGNLRYISEDVR